MQNKYNIRKIIIAACIIFVAWIFMVMISLVFSKSLLPFFNRLMAGRTLGTEKVVETTELTEDHTYDDTMYELLEDAMIRYENWK